MNYCHLFSCLFIPFRAGVLKCIIHSPYLCFSHFLLFISQLTAVYSTHTTTETTFTMITDVFYVLNHVFSVGTKIASYEAKKKKNHTLYIKTIDISTVHKGIYRYVLCSIKII